MSQRKVVAAGLGFQNADSSSITVKTYDADSGEVLSNETYELDIKEEGPAAGPQPRERIFAGGIGIGTDGSSEFTLRVYDAGDGRFLWEGRLNLRETPSDSDVVRVAATLHPRATVRYAAIPRMSDLEPSFLLQVINPETGRLVWSDRFTTFAGDFHPKLIHRSDDDSSAPRLQEIDFRIQMFDGDGGGLLWEDQVRADAASDAILEPSQDEMGTLQQAQPTQADGLGQQI